MDVIGDVDAFLKQSTAFDVPMESWRQVWRNGFVPGFSTAAIEALRDALAIDDVRLVQGSTSVPPPLMACEKWPCEAACALGFCGWQGDELETVGEVEEFFARNCFEADQRIGEPAACRWFLNWFDDTPRDEMRRELLAEVERALAEQQTKEVHHVEHEYRSDCGSTSCGANCSQCPLAAG